MSAKPETELGRLSMYTKASLVDVEWLIQTHKCVTPANEACDTCMTLNELQSQLSKALTILRSAPAPKREPDISGLMANMPLPIIQDAEFVWAIVPADGTRPDTPWDAFVLADKPSYGSNVSTDPTQVIIVPQVMSANVAYTRVTVKSRD